MDNPINKKIVRRALKRKPAEVTVYLKAPKGYVKCKTLNISKGGVFVATEDKSFLVGDQVDIIFVQEEGEKVIRLRRYLIQIIHKTFHGVGVKFCNRKGW